MSEMSAGRSLAYYAAEVGLNKRQRAFAEALLSDPKRNKGLAAKKAGYSTPHTTGYKVAKCAKVLQFMELVDSKATKEAEKEAQKTAHSVVMGLKDVKVRLSEIASGKMYQYTDVEGVLDLNRIKAEDKGHLVRRMSKSGMAEPTDALTALSKLGEHYKMFEPKAQVQPQINLVQVVNQMDPKEQTALREGLRALTRGMLQSGAIGVEAEE